MAVLAVLSLGATVFVAQRALSDARDVVVRGEADSLLPLVAADLNEETNPPTNATLEKALKAHEAQGLRYVALVDREGHAFVEAGTAEMSGTAIRSAGDHKNPHIAAAYALAGADLGSLARLRLAVDLHAPFGDQRLAGAAAVAEARQLEQLVELDVVAVQREFDGVHAGVRQRARSVPPGAGVRHFSRGSSLRRS